MNQLLTALLSGIIVFIATKMFERTFLEPILHFNQNIGRLQAKLSFYARNIANPILIFDSSEKLLDEYNKCSDEIRMIWAEVSADYMVIHRMLIFRNAWIASKLRMLFQIPEQKDFGEAMSRLIRISNGLTTNNSESRLLRESDNVTSLELIKEKLRLR